MSMFGLSRFLGWFSILLGIVEITAPAHVSRALGLSRILGKTSSRWTVRAFGAREVAAGITILVKPDAPLGPVMRIAGDAMDLGVLIAALSPENDRREAASLAFVMTAGITALDFLCASNLVLSERRRAGTAQRTHVRISH